MFCSCRISTDKCLAQSLCNSRVSCLGKWSEPCQPEVSLMDYTLNHNSKHYPTLHSYWGKSYVRNGRIIIQLWFFVTKPGLAATKSIPSIPTFSECTIVIVQLLHEQTNTRVTDVGIILAIECNGNQSSSHLSSIPGWLLLLLQVKTQQLQSSVH